jgi:hypothetical protein
MNERLKQLAIESKLIAPEYNGFDHTRLSISQQRFAELIVRECLDIVANADMTELEGPDPEDVLYVACKQIKQYFGVEE